MSKFLWLGVSVFSAFILLGTQVAIKSIENTSNNVATISQASLGSSNRPFPEVALTKSHRGEEAILALGSKFAEVAAYYGLTEEELKNLFRHDSDLNVDRTGRLLYIDTQNIVNTSLPSGTSVNSDGLLPLDQTFALHSRPGVTKKIYLDFTGHVTSGTWWNNSYGNNIVSEPFDLDGDPSTYNDSERTMIQQIWMSVAEDYLPFNVDVTTADPGNLGRNGSRIVISPTNWYSSGAGGTCYVGSFNSDVPCFAFTQQLGNYYKYISDAVTHEAGHALGLNHDGNSSGAYYYGHADWAPIMGVAYYAGIGQWSKGEYANANNTQDDFAVIGSYVNQVADDVGNTISVARNADVIGNSLSASGVIEKGGDIDFYKFNSGPGFISFNVSLAPMSTNLDAELSIYDSAGRVLATANPAGYPAYVDTTVTGGTYYVGVRSVGARDPYVDGYSNYGSVGQYYITGTIVGTSDNPPIVSISANPSAGAPPLAVQFSSAGSYDPEDGILSYFWNFGDNTSSTEANPSKTYQNGGNYTATLTATDVTNLSTLKSVQISVTNQVPVANFTLSYPSNNIPVTVALDASSSYDPDGTIALYAWDFGDGNTATGINASHTYYSAGSYTIKLTVTDANGLTGTKAVSFSAVDPNIVAAPTGLTGSSGGKNKGMLTLKWTDNSSNETAFIIERAIKSTSPVYEAIAQTGVNVNTYTQAITAGTYYYRVRAFNGDTGKYSGYSNVISVRAR